MKKYKILIITIIIFVLSLSLIACSVPKANEDITDPFYKNWMSYIIDNALIKQISIPGSHDSGTIGMNAMYCTQNTSIKQQLNTGVRYFDIRIRKEKDNRLVIFHAGSSGVDFLPILQDIVTFIKENPSEFLILDFQHFDKDSELNVIAAIKEYKLSDYALINNTEKSELDWINELTLKECRGKALICWGREKGSDSEYVYRRNNDECTLDGCVLDSYYYGNLNRLSTSKYIQEGLPFYYSKYKEKNKGLWVLQGQLTKPGANLFNLEKKHNPNMNEYIDNIKNDENLLKITNIIMRDFIGNDTSKVDNIIKLNKYKGIAPNLE